MSLSSLDGLQHFRQESKINLSQVLMPSNISDRRETEGSYIGYGPPKRYSSLPNPGTVMCQLRSTPAIASNVKGREKCDGRCDARERSLQTTSKKARPSFSAFAAPNPNFPFEAGSGAENASAPERHGRFLHQNVLGRTEGHSEFIYKIIDSNVVITLLENLQAHNLFFIDHLCDLK